MSGAGVPRLVLAGEPRHGVARHARELAEAVAARVGADVSVGAGAGAGGRLHAHFTDRLWGADPDAAAACVEGLAARAALTVTLHDLPQASDGGVNLPRRIDAYRRVVAAARGVVVSSAHEAALLAGVVGVPGAPTVIPLPVDVRPLGERPAPDAEVALLGFVYPGKGHDRAIAAVAALGPGSGLGVTALGCPSPGHEAELETLAAEAARRAVRFTVTGYLGDEELLARARRAAVPLAAHVHVSASGSIGAWVGAGRRPLVPDTGWSREMAARRPGTLTPFAPDDLPVAIARAHRDPASTWWGPGAILAPGLDDVAAVYLAWWADEVSW